MENEQLNRNEQPKGSFRGTLPLVITLVGMGALTAGVWVRDSHQMDAFEADRAREAASLNQSLTQANSQIRELSSRLDTLSQARLEAAQPARSVKRTAAGARRKAAVRVANDPRVDKLQGQLNDTQNDLARTRDEIARTRDDVAQTKDGLARTRDEMARGQEALDGKISSTRDDLNGSIAKTHDEVLALRKRGELNVYEFHLGKSKEFERVGPLSISLRGANAKRRTYDLAMIVEDNPLSKKHVNLYEPIWIRVGDRLQPVELVVNHVGKNDISGYLSEPKYKKSELVSASEKPAERPQQLVSR